MKYTACTNVDAYIEQSPDSCRPKLLELRKLILEIATDAKESISYHMPAYKTFGKPLVYFAAHDHHIGFYALPSGHETFAKELSRYKTGKGSVQFPLNEDLPVELIKQMIKFRVKENQEKYGSNSKKSPNHQ